MAKSITEGECRLLWSAYKAAGGERPPLWPVTRAAAHARTPLLAVQAAAAVPVLPLRAPAAQGLHVRRESARRDGFGGDRSRRSDTSCLEAGGLEVAGEGAALGEGCARGIVTWCAFYHVPPGRCR